jgi:hypothetical protein
MFLRRIIGTPSQLGALPFFSFLIMFLISLGDEYVDESFLNALSLRAEELYWTVADKLDCVEFS